MVTDDKVLTSICFILFSLYVYSLFFTRMLDFGYEMGTVTSLGLSVNLSLSSLSHLLEQNLLGAGPQGYQRHRSVN